jgi:hypothetical protein
MERGLRVEGIAEHSIIVYKHYRGDQNLIVLPSSFLHLPHISTQKSLRYEPYAYFAMVSLTA